MKITFMLFICTYLYDLLVITREFSFRCPRYVDVCFDPYLGFDFDLDVEVEVEIEVDIESPNIAAVNPKPKHTHEFPSQRATRVTESIGLKGSTRCIYFILI